MQNSVLKRRLWCKKFASKSNQIHASQLHEVLAAVSLESSEDDMVVVYNRLAAAHDEALQTCRSLRQARATSSALLDASSGSALVRGDAPDDLVPTDCSLPAVKKRDACIASLKASLKVAKRSNRGLQAKLHNETMKLDRAKQELKAFRARVELRRRRNVTPAPCNLNLSSEGMTSSRFKTNQSQRAKGLKEH